MGIAIFGGYVGKFLSIRMFLFSVCIFQMNPSYAVVKDLVLRYVPKLNNCQQTDNFLFICGHANEQIVFDALIKEVLKTQTGQETWEAIKNSGNYLMLVHDPLAVSSAGRAVAELSSKLTNGIGTSVIIYFHVGIPDSGSHVVGGTIAEWTDFTKQQNFFHELSHARHKTNGTWNIIHSEEQAIQDENIYRVQSTPENLNLRSLDWDKGMQVWEPLLF